MWSSVRCPESSVCGECFFPSSFGTAYISLFSVSNKNWTVFEIFVCPRHGLCWWASEHRLRFQLQPQSMLTCIIALCSNFCLVYRMFNSIKLNLWAPVSLISSADQTIHAHSSLNDPDGRFCTHVYVSNYRVHIITAHFLVALGNGQHILKHPAKLSKNPFLVMRWDKKKERSTRTARVHWDIHKISPPYWLHEWVFSATLK